MVAGGSALTTVIIAGCGDDVEVDRRSISAASVGGRTGFSPESITVSKGHEVVLTVDNNTDRVHGFSIEGRGERREIQPNRPVVVNFRPEQAGTYRIFCHLHDTHQAARLVVE